MRLRVAPDERLAKAKYDASSRLVLAVPADICAGNQKGIIY